VIRHPCYDRCTRHIADGILAAAEAIDSGLHAQYRNLTGNGDIFELEFMCAKPIFADAWWEHYHCPHGLSYWVRPGARYRAIVTGEKP